MHLLKRFSSWLEFKTSSLSIMLSMPTINAIEFFVGISENFWTSPLSSRLLFSLKLNKLQGWRNRGGDFGRSVNPISTKGGRLCPPHYYVLATQDFRTFHHPWIGLWNLRFTHGAHGSIKVLALIKYELRIVRVVAGPIYAKCIPTAL